MNVVVGKASSTYCQDMPARWHHIDRSGGTTNRDMESETRSAQFGILSGNPRKQLTWQGLVKDQWWWSIRIQVVYSRTRLIGRIPSHSVICCLEPRIVPSCILLVRYRVSPKVCSSCKQDLPGPILIHVVPCVYQKHARLVLSGRSA
jgi:hypothetical protein